MNYLYIKNKENVVGIHFLINRAEGFLYEFIFCKDTENIIKPQEGSLTDELYFCDEELDLEKQVSLYFVVKDYYTDFLEEITKETVVNLEFRENGNLEDNVITYWLAYGDKRELYKGLYQQMFNLVIVLKNDNWSYEDWVEAKKIGKKTEDITLTLYSPKILTINTMLPAFKVYINKNKYYFLMVKSYYITCYGCYTNGKIILYGDYYNTSMSYTEWLAILNDVKPDIERNAYKINGRCIEYSLQYFFNIDIRLSFEGKNVDIMEPGGFHRIDSVIVEKDLLNLQKKKGRLITFDDDLIEKITKERAKLTLLGKKHSMLVVFINRSFHITNYKFI